MIKEKDLRIGNLVKQPLTTYIAKITAIDYIEDKYFCKFKNIHSGCWCSHIEPIKLTEKWLLKGGAKKKETSYIFERFEFNFLKTYNFFYVRDAETGAYITKIEFVHELQNLIFILNGTEIF